MPHRRRTEHRNHKQTQPVKAPPKTRGTPGPYDFRQIGPLSPEGVVASDLPDHGRGSVNTNPGKELARKLPRRTGENSLGDVGMRGTPDIADAEEHGHRKRS